MSYTSSNNMNFPLFGSTGTAKPGDPFYFWKKYSYESQGPALYRLNMPLLFDQYPEIIPIPANSLRQDDNLFNSCLNDALKRHQEINNGVVFNISKVGGFLQILEKVCTIMELQPFIIFNKFATKIELSFNGKKFTLDYDHEEIDNLFIMSPINGTLIVKECTLDKMEETLRSF